MSDSPFSTRSQRARMTPTLKNSPKIIVVAGTSSNAGKTTLVCDLLAALPGWEAIKVTRGHYRSCGKETDACCVAHLLGKNALVYSTPEQTRVNGKDTDRFWSAGASNVHWVIAKAEQLEAGVNEAISRVRADGVIIESTSALAFLEPEAAILVATDATPIKPSARKALREKTIDAIYFRSTLPHGSVNSLESHSNGIPTFNPPSIHQMFAMLADCMGMTFLEESAEIDDARGNKCLQ